MEEGDLFLLNDECVWPTKYENKAAQTSTIACEKQGSARAW